MKIRFAPLAPPFLWIAIAFLLPLGVAAPRAWGQVCQVDTCTTCSRPAPGVDADGDGVPDALEYDLAHRFFPSVKLQWSNLDLWETYFYLNRSMPFSVQPMANNGICDQPFECLELRFGLAYRNDMGDDLFGHGHLGDSEFYAGVVIRTAPWSTASADGNSWNLIRDFTAAHWGESLADSSRVGAYGDCPCAGWSASACQAHAGLCNFYPASCNGVPSDPKYSSCSIISNYPQCVTAGCVWLDPLCTQRDMGCYSSSPATAARTLYASEGKHGTYHTDGECDAGNFLSIDDCPNNSIDLRQYKGNLLQNVGNATCKANMDSSLQHPNFCDAYDVWGGQKFGEATAYNKHFTTVFDWGLPGASQATPPPPAPASCPPPGGGSSGCPACGEASCSPVTAAYLSHFTGLDCTGAESYYTPYFNTDGIRRSWDGGGCVGTALRTETNRSFRGADGICYNSWPSGNTLAGFVRVYRTPSCACGEAGCSPVQAAYLSHYTGAGCNGEESYYTPYFNTDGIRRSWDGTGCTGTTLRTVTNRSYRDATGACFTQWPSGNTLSGFVRVYRPGRCVCGEGSCAPVTTAYISHFSDANCTGEEYYYTPYFNSDGVRRSWDGKGCTGTTLQSVSVRSVRDSTGACSTPWPSGNPLTNLVRVYR